MKKISFIIFIMILALIFVACSKDVKKLDQDNLLESNNNDNIETANRPIPHISGEFHKIESALFEKVQLFGEHDNIDVKNEVIVYEPFLSYTDSEMIGTRRTVQFEGKEFSAEYSETYNEYGRLYHLYYEVQDGISIEFMIDSITDNIHYVSITPISRDVGVKISVEDAKFTCVNYVSKYLYKDFDANDYETNIYYNDGVYQMDFYRKVSDFKSVEAGHVVLYEDGALYGALFAFAGEFKDIILDENVSKEIENLNVKKIEELYGDQKGYTIIENAKKTIIKLSDGKLGILCENTIKYSDGFSESIKLLYTLK